MMDGAGITRPRFLISAFWAILAAASFAVMIASVRYMDGKFDAFEIVFFRALIGVFIVIPLVSRSGFSALRTNRLPMHLVRTVFALFAMATLYYALPFIPVAQAVALTFLIPLFTTVAAGTVLGETVSIHRWGATLVGFGGALIIIRPGFVDISLPILLVVLSSALYAGAWSSVKILTKTESAAATVFWMNLLMVPLTAIPLIFVWENPGSEDVVPIAFMALSGWAAHFCQARAFATADASSVMPFDFLRLPLGALFGYLLFSELIDGWTWAGAVVIFLAGYYISRREARKNRN
ncbi:MAG: Riboflavin transporter [Alphaproteobacteria bacterium MarineAlpha11_Bin1]|nr:MAG: Riboflavin transporter [Alphaproteobacteria bacterium MarineAlpha11_Bin1]|tara:strand:- start:1722 stop:2603 length:882 start_codon:yes stop_codon:yes gene_type:complete